MLQSLTAWPGPDHARGLLFAPSSRYPTPVAYLIDRAGNPLHTWSHPADQPRPSDHPPNFLRGWNHVELDAYGNLFAIVALRSVLKLTWQSKLAWSCDVAAHHDLAICRDGTILVLSEQPRRVVVEGRTLVVLDNLVTTISVEGTVKTEVSLYDTLRSARELRQLIDGSVWHRHREFERRGWPTPMDDVLPTTAEETRAILQTATYQGERRHALRLLRALPGSPCDVLHTNTLELVAAHPRGVWDDGDVLVSMRELDTIAVVNLARAEVRWWWGAGKLSRQHQPSVLPDGRILVFDNGVRLRRTRLVVVEPSTREVVWTWSANPPDSLFCPLAGGCERLANGNLLVTVPASGEAFELTMDGEIVWQLKLPVDVYGAERGRVSIYRISAFGSASPAPYQPAGGRR